MPQIVVEVDLDFRVVYVNRPTAPIFTSEVTVGDDLLDVLTSQAADAIVDAVDGAVRTGGALTEYRADNEIYSVSAKALDSEQGTLVIIESAAPFDGRGSAVRQLLKDHSRFLSAVRYDLANPLSAVTGCAQVLLDRDESLNEATRASLVRHMNEEAYNLTSALDDLRTALSMELGQLELASVPFDAASVVSQVLSGIGVRAEGIEFDPGAPTMAIGDSVHYTQIVRTVLLNSVVEGGGKVAVHLEKEQEQVVLTVKDFGSVVGDQRRPTEKRNRAYPPTPRKVGLGLWVARELAGRMRGSLRFDQTGSDVQFVLAIPADNTKHD